jgi:hypothetical protein
MAASKAVFYLRLDEKEGTYLVSKAILEPGVVWHGWGFTLPQAQVR